jgi:hypothetical protein
MHDVLQLTYMAVLGVPWDAVEPEEHGEMQNILIVEYLRMFLT